MTNDNPLNIKKTNRNMSLFTKRNISCIDWDFGYCHYLDYC